jgi:hypothetical protein
MNEEPSTAKLWLVRVILPAAVIVGVGLLLTTQPTPRVADMEGEGSERLRNIGLAIDEATTRLGRPPANEEELRPYLAEQGSPDRLLVSPIDNEPYVVLWGIDIRTGELGTVLAYDRKAQNGLHHVLTAAGVVRLTEAELQAKLTAR